MQLSEENKAILKLCVDKQKPFQVICLFSNSNNFIHYKNYKTKKSANDAIRDFRVNIPSCIFELIENDKNKTDGNNTP